MTQDEMKQAVARAAVDYAKGGIIGVGTGSTANYFIDALADVKGRIDGAVASSEATAARLEAAVRAILAVPLEPRPSKATPADPSTPRSNP